MCLDHECLKIKPNKRRLVGIVNVLDTNLKDQRQDLQLLLVLNKPIWEAVVVVQVHVQWTHIEEDEQVEVYFHTCCQHLKNKLE
jgi:hypothetical protein